MADEQMKRIAVKTEDIEQMILMSDKVVEEVMMGHLSNYDSNGVPFPYDEFRQERRKEQFERDYHDSKDRLVWNKACTFEKAYPRHFPQWSIGGMVSVLLLR